MKTEEFWDKYINEDILEIFDITCDFFSKELPKDFVEDYDVGEVILETRGHQENAKNFDNVLKFTEILQKNQNELYTKYYQYFNDFLVDYYCFQQNGAKINQAFSNFIEMPDHDIDSYIITFKKLVFYQQTELIEKAINENIAVVKESEELLNGAEYDLEICKFYMIWQELFLEQDDAMQGSMISARFSEANLTFDDENISQLEIGILKPQTIDNELKNLDLYSSDTIVKGFFLRHMYKKGFEFYLSGMIWDKLCDYWYENNDIENSADEYFNIEAPAFEKYLMQFSSIFLNNMPELIALLWGSVYIYEFLYENEIISKQCFENHTEVSRQLKGKVIAGNLFDLWNSNFVHKWEKPNCISEEEFLEESNIFTKSIAFKNKGFKRLRSEISEELSKIGELSEYIIEGSKEDTNDFNTQFLDSLFSSSGHDNIKHDNHAENTPVKAEKKVGRNEPCPCGSGKKYKKCCGKK